MEEHDLCDLPGETPTEVIDKIEAFARDIQNDWNAPKGRLNTILDLCDKLKTKNEEI